MVVSPTPLTITGRVLQPPQLAFKVSVRVLFFHYTQVAIDVDEFGSRRILSMENGIS